MDLYTTKAADALKYAGKIAKKLHHSYTGTEHILLGLLNDPESMAGKILSDYGVKDEKLLELIGQLIAPEGTQNVMDPEGYTPRARRVLENSIREAKAFGGERVGTEHLLLAILKEQDSVAARLLNTIGVDAQKMYIEMLAAMGQEVRVTREDLKNGRFLREASAGASTVTLDQYSRDITALAREGKLDPVIGRNEEIQRVVQILSRRTKNNPCLIGEPGVGKTAIVEGLALRIVKGDIPDSVRGKRVVSLDLSGVVAGSKYRGEFEERIKKIIGEVTAAGNVLLFIDEIHTLIGAGGAEGAIDASNILKPSLARGELQLIGATTLEEYRKYIEKDAALERRFQPVNVEEPTREQTVEILKGLRSRYEDHHKVKITDEAVETAVKLSARYINDRFLPDKAIDLIDEAASKVRLYGFTRPDSIGKLEQQIKKTADEKEKAILEETYDRAGELRKEQQRLEERKIKLERRYMRESLKKERIVDAEEIAQVVSEWTKIPVQRISEGEGEKLLKLESLLHQRVIGQDEAVAALSRAVKRGRVGLKDPNRPIGSFLFLGPTGVGKTELSKALSEVLFGKEQAMIRVDMSEYMEKHSVSKMIGSPPGYVGHDDGGQLSEKVRRNPYSVILFDEIEKAHPDVFNILLQVLDDGHITDSQGRKVSFKNTVIIMTSNVGAQEIVSPKKLGFASGEDEKKDYENMKSRVMEEVRRMFKPEFLNRIDEIMVFHPLNRDHVKKIVTLMLKELSGRCREQMNIQLTVRDSVKNYIVENGFDDKYGARPLKRAIQNKIEDPLAEEILSGKVKAGDEVAAGMSKKGVKFYVLS
ncbi:MAG: ATP-dependent Clp protease ATP-binding subunit [Lachnospiraceae bacterium]|nr:ATP-dependent Clp protease ATP-binding subunit [Lachnospiraceae bacterium]